MTAIAQERPFVQPQSKAPPTVQSSHPDVVATKTTSVNSSRAPSKARLSKIRQDVAPADFTSKTATLALIRRTLIADASQPNDPRLTPLPIEGVLPPLTSSNEVDLQLYAIVAIVVKDFVNTWYSKITQDHAFVDEVVQIIAHCSRALEQRIRHIDIAELVLDEVPLLLERHVQAYRTSTSSMAHHSYNVDSRVIYHHLNPHPALDPVPIVDQPETSSAQAQNEVAYRQILVNGTLGILLPTEDLQNTPLRILVSDIIADLVLGQAVAGKVCEGWFLHDAISKAVNASKQTVESKASGQELRNETKTRLEHFGLLNTGHNDTLSSQTNNQSIVAMWFWRIMQWMYLIVMAGRLILQGLFHARHLPDRFRSPSSTSGSLKTSPKPLVTHEYDQSPQPVLAYGVSNLVSTITRLQNRMPWLGSAIMFCQHVLLVGSGQLGAANSIFDRFLHHTLTTYIFTPQLFVSVLVGLRTGVFPNNSLGPPAPPPPSADEQIEIRRRAAKAILSLIPTPIAHKFFDSGEEDDILQQIEEDILDVFGDKYMNKHLIYNIIELILVKLVPELQESGVGDLLAERGINWSIPSAKVDGNIDAVEGVKDSKHMDFAAGSNSKHKYSSSVKG